MSAGEDRPKHSERVLKALQMQAVMNALTMRRRARDATAALTAIENAMTAEERAAYRVVIEEGV